MATARTPIMRMVRRPPRRMIVQAWQELAGLVALCAGDDWIFRGEHLPDPRRPRPLRPKAGRPESRKVPYRFADERSLLDLFKRRARPLVGHQPKSDLEWLAIAQHHGMPTRLLDWTDNLLVAAYFASLRLNTAWGIVYAVHGLREVSIRDERSPFEARLPGIYRPPHISPRIPTQGSIFTLHPKPTKTFRPKNLYVWRITPLAAGQIKISLDACAINRSSLFPDLDGLAGYLEWRYKWGRVEPRRE